MRNEFEAVIGLEVHAQLLTKSKIFCGCSTRFGDPPNTNTCPVCLGLPGALPVINREAVSMAAKAAMALECRINRESVFARKNYFYPDLPKGYQISQYELPLAEAGRVDLEYLDEQQGDAGPVRASFRINRIHLEDDAGKSVHSGSGGTLVNLNRTGVPLIEIVTEADFRSSREAYEFLTYLRRVLLYLGICDGNMEEGSLRCDANISVRQKGEKAFGTKTEIKNLNSFRFVRKALDYEISRQIETLGQGGEIVQETRLWDEEKQVTFPMRSKEEAHDYRYFPDPDLLPLRVNEEWLEQLEKEIPELPEARRRRFVDELGIPFESAALLTQSRAYADYFEAALGHYRQPTQICNWILGDLTRDLKKNSLEIDQSPVSAENLADLVRSIDEQVISGKIAKEVFSKMFESGKTPEEIIKAEGLRQISSSDALEEIIDRILEANPEKVQAFRKGKEGLIGFFVGQVMRETRGQANPRVVNELLSKKLRGPDS